MKKKLPAFIPFLVLIALFLLHLPFLTADPDIYLSTSRDAFTDEGLNTSQLRNYINHGYLDFRECDNLVKTPFFNAVLLLPLKIYGTHLIIARLTILLFLFVVLFLLSANNQFRKLVLLLAPATLLQYYVFQYSHFSLSEMLSISCILLAIFFLYKSFENEFRKPTLLFLSSFFIALSYYSKIQYLYIIPLIPTSLLLQNIISRKKSEGVFPSLKIILHSVGWMLFFLLIYIIAWYLPHKDIFDYVMKDEAGGKYADIISIPRTIAFNIVYVLFSKSTWFFNLLVLVCFILGSILWLRTSDRRFKFIFLLSAVWVILELHKLTMTYLPSRYLVSYYFASGFLSCVVLSKMIFNSGEEKDRTLIPALKLKQLGWMLAGMFLLKNSIDYISMLNRKEYNISYLNNYFSNTINDDNELVMGPWAPSLTWDSKVICKPVWHNFMNDKNIFEQHPRVIISEPDEAESNQAYSSQQINLSEHADSVREFEVGKWKVEVYWIREEDRE